MTTKNFAPPQDDKTKRNGRALRAPQNDNKGENALLRMTNPVIPSEVKQSVGIDRLNRHSERATASVGIYRFSVACPLLLSSVLLA